MPSPLGHTLGDAYAALNSAYPCEVERANDRVRFRAKGDRGQFELEFKLAKTRDVGLVAIVEGMQIDSSRSPEPLLYRGAEAHAMLMQLIRENPPPPPAKTGEPKIRDANELLDALKQGGSQPQPEN